MTNNLKTVVLFGACFIGLAIGALLARPRPLVEGVAHFEASYDDVSLDQMIIEADLVILGHVVKITPARWNQDDGMYWEQAGRTTVPFHEIEIEVTESLRDKIGLGKTATITVLGNSPLGILTTSAIQLESEVAHTLAVGDERIFFLVQRDLVWREGSRPILRFLGMPEAGYLTHQVDGLYHSLTDHASSPLSLDQLRTRLAESTP